MYDEKLVTDNLALAKYVAKKYIQSGLEYDDLLQVAYEGLVLAAARYDPGKGFAFSTFAVCCMEKRIWMQFRKKGVDAESLEDPIPGTDLVLADALEDPTDAFAEMALRDALVWAIGRLKPRERYVIEAQYSAREVRGYPGIAEVAIEGLLTKLVVETVNEYRAQCRFRRASAKEDFADIVNPKQKEEVSGDASGELSPL